MAGDAGEQDPALLSWADKRRCGERRVPLHPSTRPAWKGFLPQQAQTDMGEPQGHRQGPAGGCAQLSSSFRELGGGTGCAWGMRDKEDVVPPGSQHRGVEGGSVGNCPGMQQPEKTGGPQFPVLGTAHAALHPLPKSLTLWSEPRDSGSWGSGRRELANTQRRLGTPAGTSLQKGAGCQSGWNGEGEACLGAQGWTEGTESSGVAEGVGRGLRFGRGLWEGA